MKNCCASRKTINKVKRQYKESKKITANSIPDSDPNIKNVQRIFKTLYTIKKINNSTKKSGNAIEDIFKVQI